MDIAQIVGRVDSERIYQHVLKLEGTRHAIDTPEKLDEAADYIRSEFKEHGLRVNDQEFKVENFDAPFRNIEGVIGNGADSELLIVSHYDTVRDCPGANDNGSAVAAMLECARVLAQEKDGHNVRFVSFTLEELNPARVLRTRKIAQSLGLTDGHHRYTTLRTQKFMRQLIKLQAKGSSAGKNPTEVISELRHQLEDQMSESEATYLRKMEEMSKGITTTSWPGRTSLMGSSFWVEEAFRTRKKVSGVLCLETIGYTSNKEHSQIIPEGMDPKMFQTYKVTDITVGNFLAIIGDANSGKLAQSFCAQSKLGSVDLPYACVQIPLHYEEIAQLGLHDLLRSDHAPFWREGIPGLLLTDTANFRYPFYHTQADTVDKLDFDFITKVCKATIATAINLTNKRDDPQSFPKIP